jgi:excisionase family DNA binding protein
MSGRARSRLLSATQVARHCGVDLKTIHNWANKGKIPCHRTTGRHLRFRPLDVVSFLRAYELGLPESLRDARLHVLVVDPDAQTCAAVRRALGRRFEVVACGHVVDALLLTATLLPDVFVAGDVSPLDVSAISARLRANEATRHVRVVALGDPARVRETLERVTTEGEVDQALA